jgi:nanoRNase/pAp phosphatase (c-di-AMP/oligoRNAs hydrolase)
MITNSINYQRKPAELNTTKQTYPASLQSKEARTELANLLFGKSIPQSAHISFGWSEQTTAVEREILDILTDSKYKSAIIAAHTFPDGDALGSCIGMAGILESLGKQVYPIIDFRPKKTFANLPSPRAEITANEYIKTPESINKFKMADLAIITDTGEPSLLSQKRESNDNAVLDTILKTKPQKVIIIDHHSDDNKGKSNKQIWHKALKERGVSEKDILYWREPRASAAEMVSELDKEIVDESKTRAINGYKPDALHHYRMAVATGILTDANGSLHPKGEVDKTKFARMSYKKVTGPEGNKVSTTRYDFDWLVNNSDIPKTEIDTSQYVERIELSDTLLKKISNIVDGKETIAGIKVKTPGPGDPLGYINIDNWAGIDRLAREWEEDNISGRFIYKLIKSRMCDKLMEDKNAGVYVLANRSGKNTFLTVRSYGYDYYHGEMYEKGHVFGNDLALKVINALEPMHGSGGGHKNAAGFKSHKYVNFEKTMLPIINKIVGEYVKNNDIKEIPQKELIKGVSFTAQKLNAVV